MEPKREIWFLWFSGWIKHPPFLCTILLGPAVGSQTFLKTFHEIYSGKSFVLPRPGPSLSLRKQIVSKIPNLISVKNYALCDF